MDNNIKWIIIILALLNLVVGCIAGIILIELTGNSIYIIVNLVTGGASGALFALAQILYGRDE